MKKIGTKQFSQKGHESRWNERYTVLKELGGYVSKARHNEFMKWPTTHLATLLAEYRKQRHGRTK